MSELVHVATIAAPHGVKGQFKLHSNLTDHRLFASLKNYLDQDGEPIHLQIISSKAKLPIAALENISTPEAAALLRGTKIFVKAADLPEIEDDEIYSYAFQGLKVLNEQGQQIGQVIAHHYYGAGDILEIKFKDGKTDMLPYCDEVFPEVNIDAGYLTCIPPEYI